VHSPCFPGLRFDWFTRSRPDLACLWPLPSLRSLPPVAVYALPKEAGALWDTWLAIPRGKILRLNA